MEVNYRSQIVVDATLSNVRAQAYLKFRQDGLTLPTIGRFFGRDHTTVMKVTNNMVKNGKG
jgi:chromosomal replication initiation ATPase DnaA